MKCLDKKMMLLPLLIFLGYGNNVFGYIFNITNFTGEDIKVRLHYAFGKLNGQEDLIMPMETRNLKFGGLKVGLCLTKIVVRTSKRPRFLFKGIWRNGPREWSQEVQTAEIQWVSRDDFQKLKQTPIVGPVFKELLKWWKKIGCGNRDFILVVDPPGSGKVVAITY